MSAPKTRSSTAPTKARIAPTRKATSVTMPSACAPQSCDLDEHVLPPDVGAAEDERPSRADEIADEARAPSSEGARRRRRCAAPMRARRPARGLAAGAGRSGGRSARSRRRCAPRRQPAAIDRDAARRAGVRRPARRARGRSRPTSDEPARRRTGRAPAPARRPRAPRPPRTGPRRAGATPRRARRETVPSAPASIPSVARLAVFLAASMTTRRFFHAPCHPNPACFLSLFSRRAVGDWSQCLAITH